MVVASLIAGGHFAFGFGYLDKFVERNYIPTKPTASTATGAPMTPSEMKVACDEVMSSYRSMGLPDDKASISLVTPKGWRPPKGFPRGYLLQVKADGTKVSHFNASRTLKWLESNEKDLA